MDKRSFFRATIAVKSSVSNYPDVFDVIVSAESMLSAMIYLQDEKNAEVEKIEQAGILEYYDVPDDYLSCKEGQKD